MPAADPENAEGLGAGRASHVRPLRWGLRADAVAGQGGKAAEAGPAPPHPTTTGGEESSIRGCGPNTSSE